jgi:hypothetical protein
MTSAGQRGSVPVTTNDNHRLREFWNNRYREFTLSESGWMGAGEALNDDPGAFVDQDTHGAPFPWAVDWARENRDKYTKEKHEVKYVEVAGLGHMWTASAGGKTLMTMPKGTVVRSIMLNHWYQHRGQFGVYLRLMGAKVPSSYGPSADELPEFLQGK